MTKITEFDIRLGRKVKLMRQMRRVSQDALAKSLGITFQQIQKYERGKNRIAVSRLVEIARVLRVDINKFFEDSEFQQQSTSFEEIDFAHYIEILHAFEAMKNQAAKSEIKNFVKRISGKV